MKSLLARALVLALILPAAALAQSQATTGVIEGTVRDESGASIPGATVSFRNTATNFERSAESDADGRFRGLLLPLGPYRVTVTKSGFGTHVREGLDLQVGQTINLPVTLKVSALQEEVVVTGEAPGHRDDARRRLGPHRREGDRRACRTMAATSSTSRCSRRASRSSRAPTAPS